MSGWFNLIRNGHSLSAAQALPEMDTVGHEETVVALTVSNVTGGPSAAQLAARFEILQPTTQGAVAQAQPGGIWTPVDADLHPELLPDGDWPTTIADQSTVATALTKVVTTSGSTAISIGAGGAVTAPFAVGQRLQGTGLAAGSSNEVVAVGSAGAAGTSGSSATLRFPAVGTDTNGSGTALTNPVTVLRRFRRWPFWRVVLLPTFTGGTSPAFVVTVSTYSDFRR